MIEEPWALPASWHWARFDEVARVASNLVDPAEYQDAPHVAPNHIESETGRLLPYSTVSKDGVTSAKHRFFPGQVLYSKIRPYLAKVVVADFEGVCSADMYPIESELEPRYLKWWMLTREFTRRAAGEQARTVLPKINVRALSSLPVPVPPPSEQRCIVEILEDRLSRVEAAVRDLSSARRRADLLKAAALWWLWSEAEFVAEQRSVAEVGPVITGGTPRDRVTVDAGDVLPFVTPGDVHYGEKIVSVARSLPRNSYSLGRVLETPTVLAVCIGATLGKIGWADHPLATNQQINAVLVGQNHPRFVAAMMASPAFQTQMRESASATTMPILNKRAFQRLLLPLPTPTEQLSLLERLDVILESARRLLAAVGASEARAVTLRRALLAAAFSGQLTR